MNPPNEIEPIANQIKALLELAAKSYAPTSFTELAGYLSCVGLEAFLYSSKHISMQQAKGDPTVYSTLMTMQHNKIEKYLTIAVQRVVPTLSVSLNFEDRKPPPMLPNGTKPKLSLVKNIVDEATRTG